MDEGRIRAALQRRRRELAGELGRLTEAPRDPMTAVSFGKRIGDGTTEAVERINTTSAARSIAAMAGEVDRALVKLDEGTYGKCDRCGVEIPSDRLEAIAWTSTCVSCASLLARRGR
jgi:RNA polymerase-binding transcription factor